MDTCCSSSKTILQDKDIKLTNFEMTYMKSIDFAAITREYSQSNGLKITVINKIRRSLVKNKILASPNLRISAQYLVDAPSMWKLLLVNNLTRLKWRS